MKKTNMSRYMMQAATLSTLLALGACGGSAGTSSGSSQTSTISTGVMTKSSAGITVNGVRYEDSTASIVLDNKPKLAASLKDGMVVKIKGRINADRISGIADNIEADNEVRGVVEVIDTAAPPTYIEVLGQRVYVDDQTIYEDLTGIAALIVGNSVEIYGLRDANGHLQASRIELLTPTAGLPDEVHGVVSDKTTTSFKLGALVVYYSTTTVMDPPNAIFNNGDLVEVHLETKAGVTTATLIELEKMDDSSSTAGEYEVEGFVSEYVLGAQTFKLDNRNVQINSSTRFKGGSELDLMNNIKVEAEGVLSGTTLVAHKIAFKRDRVRLQGVVSVVDFPARILTVFGKLLTVTDMSELKTISAGGNELKTLAGIATGDRVKVSGFIDKSGAIIVTQLEETKDTKDIIQARVTAKNLTAATVDLLGITAQLSSTTSYEGDNDTLISMDAFLAAVTPASTTPPQNLGSLVKLKGTLSGSTLTVAEAELEDD